MQGHLLLGAASGGYSALLWSKWGERAGDLVFELLGMARTDVAAMCNSDDQQVASDVERVRTELLRDESVLFLIDAASVLNVSTDYLLGLTDDPAPPTPASGAHSRNTLRRTAGARELECRETDDLL